MRVFSPWRVVNPAAVFERVVDALQELSDRAAEHDLIIGIENEHACNIATAHDAARILAAVDQKNLRVVWDPANAFVSGEEPFPGGYQLLESKRIAHVHAKDCTLEGHKAIWCALGEGDIDWKGQFAALKQDGYSGYIIWKRIGRVRMAINLKAVRSAAAISKKWPPNNQRRA